MGRINILSSEFGYTNVKCSERQGMQALPEDKADHTREQAVDQKPCRQTYL